MEGFVFVSGGVVGAKWKGMEVCGRCPVGMGRRAVVVSHSSSSSASPSKETLEEIDPGEVEGTALRIVKYPNPILRAENAEVTEFNDELAALARDMFKVMYASRGVGLAAPQIGKNIRLLVFNPEGNEKMWLQETVLVNPRIVASSSKQDVEPEGCLSFPGMSGKVKRSLWVKVEAQTLKGKPFKMKFVDWKARIFQHEYDHLERTLYIDRLTEEGKKEVSEVLDRLIDDFDGEPAL